MIFHSTIHKNRFNELLNEVHPHYKDDGYTVAILYLQSLLNEITPNVRIFNHRTRMIMPEVLSAEWQTHTTRKITLFAFNLWNGYMDKDYPCDSTVFQIFGTSYDPYLFEALTIQFALLNAPQRT